MRSRGFTMVEVAVVVMVIGLLLGTFLLGREMIVQSRVKSIIADFSGVSAAYNSYADRYGGLPGDDPVADVRWPGAGKGNGDGFLGGAYNSTTNTDESRLWWDHLRRAGFVPGSGLVQPNNIFVGMIGVQNGAANGQPALGGMRMMLCSAGLPDKVAIAVDTLIDDGTGAGGSIRALAQTTPNPTIDQTTPTAAYVETGSNFYTVCQDLK